MISETPIITETQPRKSCCSGKTKNDKTEIPTPNKEITPIVKIEKAPEQEERGCQCCSNNADPQTDGI